MAAASVLSRAGAERTIGGLPCGRRVPKGRERWYLLKVRKGAEESTCAQLLRLVPREILRDCFALRRESWRRSGGAWYLGMSVAYGGYLFAVTDDPLALGKALAGLSLPVEPASDGERAWMPLSREVQAWFEQCADARHVLRNSVAEIVGGSVHVTDGPLAGREASIRKVDRHHRRCMVSVADGAAGFTELMPLVVPSKN